MTWLYIETVQDTNIVYISVIIIIMIMLLQSTNRKQCPLYQLALLLMTLSDLERLFHYDDNVVHVYCNILMYFFACKDFQNYEEHL